MSFIFFLYTITANIKITTLYNKTIKKGFRKSIYKSLNPFKEFWRRTVAFLNGNISNKITILSSKPSTGNHIPDNNECALITIEDIPPTLLSLHNEPNNIPNPKNNKDVNKDNRIESIISILNNDVSKAIPIKKNKIDWTYTIWIIANA